MPGCKFQLEKILKRFMLKFEDDVDNNQAASALSSVFGLANFSPAVTVPKDMNEISQVCVELMKGKEGKSFAVKARRSDKNFPLTSPEIGRQAGAAVIERYGNPVNLRNPEETCYIEVLPENVYVFTDKTQGPGGLPVNTAGKTLSLLSGGFDSPVASYYMMKRGAHCSFMHFHVYPFTEKKSQEKVKNLARVLNKFQFKSKMYMVPFADTQKAITQNCSEKYRIILYRRLMMRIAEQTALKYKYKAVVTGEALGQVASQTLENMAAVEDVIHMPVLRPLIGMDKNEIMDTARKIGTYDISVLPHDDACTRFMPKHPSIYSKIEDVRREERKLDINELVQKNLEKIDVLKIE